MHDYSIHGLLHHIAENNDSMGYMARVHKVTRQKHMDARIVSKHHILRKHANVLRCVRQSAKASLKNPYNACHAGLLGH